MSVGRRDFIVGTLGTAAAVQLLGCSDDEGGVESVAALPIDTRFTHGVASGDPLADAVILWTRAISADGQPRMVEWVIATDPGLSDEAQRGVAETSASSDFTVKVDVAGLSAGTTYYYAFFVTGAGRSPIGRTRTLPKTAARARLAFTSCANYQNGYFNAYRAIANRTDLDLWVHVGDYIYEYKAGEYADSTLTTRAHSPANEAIRLEDYRGRYAQYRADPDLQELHRQHPIIVVWDDHEFANNAYTDGAENHDPATEGAWLDRKRAGAQAFVEWLPLRVVTAEPVPKIFRTFQFADLFDLVMLDTRMWARSKQAGSDQGAFDGTNVGEPAQWKDPARHIVGDEQEDWIEQQLAASKTRGAHWRLLGNQVMFTQGRAPLDTQHNPAYILFSDFWDGYQVERDKLLNYIATNGVQNTVILTGDIHSSWALEVSTNPYDKAVYDPASGKNAVAIELVGPSITSQALEGSPQAEFAPLALRGPDPTKPLNPHLMYSEFTRKGYVLIDLDATRLQAEWWYVNDYKTPNAAAETAGKIFTVASNSARLVEATTPSAAIAAPPAAAPA
jgi:alkaline phosphatase D